jgi:hypothetical protein
MKLSLVETPTSAVLHGKDLFKLGEFDAVLEYVKKIDPATTRDEDGFTAPTLCLTAFCPEGKGKLDVVRVFTREHYERSLLEQDAGLGDEDDQEDDYDDEEDDSGEGEGGEDEEQRGGGGNKRPRDGDDDDDDDE